MCETKADNQGGTTPPTRASNPPTPPALSDSDRSLDELFERVLALLEDGEAVRVPDLAAEFGRAIEDVERAVALATSMLGGAGLITGEPLPRVPGFEVLGELGRGGMSVVYTARQHSLGGRIVALKVLPAAVSLSPSARRRFLDEARAIARFRDRHIVAIHDVIDRPGLCAYAMELIDGAALSAIIDDASWSEGALSIDRVRAVLGADRAAIPESSGPAFICRVGMEIARALHAVHEAGLVHRDVKPSNVLIRRDGTPLLSDFGLVRDVESSVRTIEGAFLGTLAYASPEQLRGDQRALDRRSDVYALGATLYHALAGRRAVEGHTPNALLDQIERAAVPPLRKANPECGRDIETVLAKAMDPDPARRYQTAGEMAGDLERILSFRAIKARPAGPIVRMHRFSLRHKRQLFGACLGGLAVAGVVVIAWLLLIARPAAATERLADARLALIDPGQGTRLAGRYLWDGQAGGYQLEAEHFAPALSNYDASIALSPFSSRARRERGIVRAAIQMASDKPSAHGLARDDLPATLAYISDRSTPTDWAQLTREDARSLGLLAFIRGDVDTAITAWSEAQRSGELDPFIEASLGQVYLWQDEPARAYPRLQHAVEAFPDAGFLMVNLADAALRCNDVARAQATLDRAASMQGHDNYNGLTRVRADLLAAQGQTTEARTHYREVMHENPVAALHLAELCEREGDMLAALDAYRNDNFLIPASAEGFLRVTDDIPQLNAPGVLNAIHKGTPRYRQHTLNLLRDALRAQEALSRKKSEIPSALTTPTSAPSTERARVASLATKLEVTDMRLWNTINKQSSPARTAATGALMLGAQGSDVARALHRTNSWQRSIPMLPILIALTAGAAQGGEPITFTEDDFAPGSYTVETIQNGLGGIASLTQVAEGGIPGAFLEVQHDLPGGPSGEWCSNAVYTFVFPTDATVDPSAIGGIAAIDCSIQSKCIAVENTSCVQSQGLVLRQGGVLYVGALEVTNEGDEWAESSFAGLEAEDFLDFVAAPSCEEFYGDAKPDFSASGGPIELGIYRGNSSGVGGADIETTIIAGADAWAVSVHPAGEPTARFIPLGILDGQSGSQAFRFSGDGSTVVGDSVAQAGGEGWRWRAGEGLVGLGSLPGEPIGSTATATNFDGSVVVGYASTVSGPCGQWRKTVGFTWTESTGVESLGFPDLSCPVSLPLYLSDDGSLAAGRASDGEQVIAYSVTVPGGAWINSGVAGDFASSQFTGGTPNGLVLVGAFGDFPSGNNVSAFRLASGGGPEIIDDLPGGADWCEATDIDESGGTVIGLATTASGTVGFEWTPGTGTMPLDDLEGGAEGAVAYRIARDGSLIVGKGVSAEGNRAVIWDEDRNVHDLADWLADRGLTIPEDWTLEFAFGIHVGDGIVQVCGRGINPDGDTEAYVARVPYEPVLPPPACPGDADGDLDIDSADLNILLGQFGLDVEPGTGADFDGNGFVDAIDLNTLLGAFGSPC